MTAILVKMIVVLSPTITIGNLPGHHVLLARFASGTHVVPISILASTCNKTRWVIRLGQNNFNGFSLRFSELTL